MKISLLTYNTLFNQGTLKLKKIINQYQPDILCLQEVDTDETKLNELKNQLKIKNYKIADYSNCFLRYGKIFGLATFYNQNNISFNNSRIIFLSHTFFEKILSLLKLVKYMNYNRNFLKTVFFHKKTKKKIIVYNTHITPFSPNGTRIKQIKHLLNDSDINKENPVIIAGDFNYFPYKRKKLENLMQSFGFKEATKKIDYTIKYSGNLKTLYYNFIYRIIAKVFGKIFTDRLKIDYIFYKNLNYYKTKRIKIQASDHYPIISTFTI